MMIRVHEHIGIHGKRRQGSVEMSVSDLGWMKSVRMMKVQEDDGIPASVGPSLKVLAADGDLVATCVMLQPVPVALSQ